jgi:hypothetical protein
MEGELDHPMKKLDWTSTGKKMMSSELNISLVLGISNTIQTIAAELFEEFRDGK